MTTLHHLCRRPPTVLPLKIAEPFERSIPSFEKHNEEDVCVKSRNRPLASSLTEDTTAPPGHHGRTRL